MIKDAVKLRYYLLVNTSSRPNFDLRMKWAIFWHWERTIDRHGMYLR